MSTSVDFRKQLLEEINELSPEQLEKVYRTVMFLKEEFMAFDEARYYTEPWIQAEREATDAYRRGGLKSYGSVDEMMDDIVPETETK